MDLQEYKNKINSTLEQIGVDVKGKAEKREPKTITNTTQLTLQVEDFFTKELIFANGATLDVFFPEDLLPDLKGSIVATVTNGTVLNFKPSNDNVTVTPITGALPKISNDGFWTAKPTAANKFIVGGSLEAADPSEGYDDSELRGRVDDVEADIIDHEERIQDLENNPPQNGETYDVFTNTEDGLVPAPNNSGGTTAEPEVSIEGITEGQEFPEGNVLVPFSVSGDVSFNNITEGQEFPEGDLTVEFAVEGGEGQPSTGNRFLREDGEWAEPQGGGKRVKPFKQINDLTHYTLKLEDRNYWLLFRNVACEVTVPEGVFDEADEIEGTVYSSPYVDFVSNGQLIYNDEDLTTRVKAGGDFGIKILPLELTGATLFGALEPKIISE